MMRRPWLWSLPLVFLLGGYVGSRFLPAGATPPAAAVYRCPMHPRYTASAPGKCPVCQMDLAREDDAVTQQDGVPGRAVVAVTPERRQLIGVRTAPVETRDLAAVIRAGGGIASDPELYNAVVEFRESARVLEQMAEATPEMVERGRSLVQTTRLHLKKLGVSDAHIERWRRAPEHPTGLLVGQPGGSVWVYAYVYEFEAGLIRPGQRLEASTPALPGQVFTGEVMTVDSNVNPDSRTVRVRAEVPNPEGVLRSEMFVDVLIRVSLGRRLAVPEEAVLDTGTRQLVFVEQEPGRYQPREVRLGRPADGYLELVSGVEERERVVVSGNFLIDSESKLKAALPVEPPAAPGAK